MKWLDKLERKFGRFAIRGLMTYIVSLNLAVFLLTFMDRSGVLISKLMLNPSMILRGEIWRLVTFIFIPPSFDIIWILFTLYFYYTVGNALESEWGSFRFNVYYIIGMLGTAIASFITGGGATATYLNLSLFLAFAQIYPNFELLLFFVFPVKIKYLAWLNWAYIAYTVIFYPVSFKVAALVSIINYFVFFGSDILVNVKMRRMVYYNRKRFFNEIKKGQDKRK